MKKIMITAVLFFSIAVLPAALFAGDYFTIDKYQLTIKVLENNSYEVTEQIDAAFTTKRRSFEQSIATRFKNRPIIISDIQVPGYATEVSNRANRVLLKIVSDDSYLSGKKSFTITYRCDVGADSTKNGDLFQFDILDGQWDTEIPQLQFSITMPKTFNSDQLAITGKSRKLPAEQTVTWTAEGNTITGHNTVPIKSGQSITASLPLPEGYWTGAQRHKEKGEGLFTFLGYPLYAAAVLLVFFLWFKFGHDKKIKAEPVSQIPAGITPAEIGFIIDGRLDNRDVSLLIIYWAERGLLTISRETTGRGFRKKKNIILTKQADLGDGAKPYEKKLFDQLFSRGNGEKVSSEELSEHFAPVMDELRSDIRSSFSAGTVNAIYTKRIRLLRLPAAVLSILPAAAVSAESFIRIFSSPAAAGILTAAAAAILMIPFFMISSTAAEKAEEKRLKLLFTILFAAAFAVLIGLIVTIFGSLPFYKYTAAVLCSLAAAMFTFRISRRTPYGGEIYEMSMGLKVFIKTAGKAQLEAILSTSPAYFYTILPYAMVLGEGRIWASHFKDIKLQAPQWYRIPDNKRFSPSAFIKLLGGSLSVLNKSLSSSPSKKISR